jgi:calcineurin-like phosphoesterase family protein
MLNLNEIKKERQMKTLFIADLHLGHANCLKFDARPWDTIDEMDEALIKRWNRKVRPEDHVYVLGDFAYRNRTSVKDYTDQLHGHIHLIRGNHDKRSVEYESCFEEVVDYKDISVEVNGVKRRVIMSHYFMPFYNGHYYDTIMLHGHTHKTEESVIEEQIKEEIRGRGIRCEAYNVGCMWQDYEPQTLEEIIARQDRQVDLNF